MRSGVKRSDLTMTRSHWLLLTTVMLAAAITGIVRANEDDDAVTEHQSRDPYNMHDYRTHTCKRPCKKDAPPMACHYYFLLEHYTTLAGACQNCIQNETDCFLPQCVPGDGRIRGILTVNRMLPGPIIDVCVGDTVVVLIDNRMELGEGTTIHWHGQRQESSPHMDGTNLITQCPISSGTKMAYRYTAADSGTHFWHAHSSIQRADGLFGGLIVRTPYHMDPHRHLYDYDLTEHFIILIDWSDKTAGEAFSQDMHGTRRADPSSVLVNGLGSSKEGPSMPHSVFKVKSGGRYRFRMAYNGIMNCPLDVTIDGHVLLMIASDGRNFEPVEVDTFTILSGERYDFVLRANHHFKGNYWIRFTGHGRCKNAVSTEAILRYDGASETTPSREATFDETDKKDNTRTLNGLDDGSSNTSIQVVDLMAIEPHDDVDVLKKRPDKQFYISIAASELVDKRFEPPSQKNISTQEPPTVRPVNHQLNYISSQLPPSPPLSQFKDIPQEYFCNNDTVTEDCSQVMCTCVHRLETAFGDIVEVVLVSFTNTLAHPMHLHGHSFRVVAMENFDHDLTVSQVKAMDRKGQIRRKTFHAPYKDTISVHAQSVVILRFRATNRGFWFFHCHIEFHAELGMALILQIGNPKKMPKAPKEFPTCGSWRPEVRHNPKAMKEPQDASVDSADGNTTTSGAVIGTCAAIVIIVLVLFGIIYKRLKNENVLYQRILNSDGKKYQPLL